MFLSNLSNIILNKKTCYFLVYFYSLLNKFVYGYLLKLRQLHIFIKPVYLIPTLSFLKNNTISSFNSLLDIAVVDFPVRNNYRFEMNYVFWNYSFEYRFVVKTYTDGLIPVFSINNLYPSSNWLEREVWDMFGIKFLFHPNLRRILTDYGFKGHPLRKDFPLVGYIDIFYDDSIQAISLTPIEVSQGLRFYQFENPWNKWRYI